MKCTTPGVGLRTGLHLDVEFRDKWIIDGIVNGIGYVTLAFVVAGNWFDKWIVDGLVNLSGMVTRWSGEQLRLAQNGQVQAYILFIILGVGVYHKSGAPAWLCRLGVDSNGWS